MRFRKFLSSYDVYDNSYIATSVSDERGNAFDFSFELKGRNGGIFSYDNTIFVDGDYESEQREMFQAIEFFQTLQRVSEEMCDCIVAQCAKIKAMQEENDADPEGN